MDKMMNTILYILQKIGEVSKTKLMKLLFLIDFEHMVTYNRPITWAEYHRLPKGPIPSHLLNIVNAVIKNDTTYVSKDVVEYFSNFIKIKKKPIKQTEAAFLSALKQPDMEELSLSEIEIIDKILEKYGNKKASDLIDITHNHPAWKKGQDNVIKYSIALSNNKKKEFFKIWEDELEGIHNIFN